MGYELGFSRPDPHPPPWERHVTRVPLALLLLTLGAACSANAATPRALALGGDGTYLEDAGNVLRWPGSLADHAGRVTVGSGVFDQDGYGADVVRDSGPWAGVQFALGPGEKPFVGAWHALARSADLGDGGLGGGLQNGAVHALLGRRGETVDFALSYRHAGNADNDRGETRKEYGVGFRFDLGPEAYMDVAGEIVHIDPSVPVIDPLPNPEIDDDETANYYVRVRAFVGLSRNVVLVPVTEVSMEDRYGSPDQETWTDRHWRLGAALTWLPDPDRLFLLSVDYQGNSAPRGLPVAAPDVLAVRGAIETRLNAFLSLRAATGWEDPRDDARPRVPVSLGLALHAGSWDLDLAWSSEPPLTPTGGRRSWREDGDGTWMSAALGFAF